MEYSRRLQRGLQLAGGRGTNELEPLLPIPCSELVDRNALLMPHCEVGVAAGAVLLHVDLRCCGLGKEDHQAKQRQRQRENGIQKYLPFSLR
jgi:hypothetical protein